MNYKKKGKNNISRNISESDLLTFPEYDGSIASRNKLLYKLGVDTSLPVEVLECQHRNLQGKVVEGKLFMCFERLDWEWVKSGHASTEAFLASGNDPTIAKEIATMNSSWGD
jgi:hypothetical protein